MKKFLLLILSTLLILLVGCSERELEFDREYPDASRVKIYKARKQAIEDEKARQIDQEINGFSFLIDSEFKPPSILLTGENNIPNTTKPANYCWQATYEECAHLELVNVFDDRVLRLYNLNYLYFKPNEKLILTYVNHSTINETMPFPDDIEIYTFNKDLSLTPYPLKKLEYRKYELTLPSDTTTYYFVIKTTYNTQIGGVTYYPIEMLLE